MIIKLDQFCEHIANNIFWVFQRSYSVEAQLIGTLTFPPLLRTAIDIKQARTQFYGFYVKECIAGIIEVEVNNKQLTICSLTVEPNFFRKGIAHKLISHVLQISRCNEAIVETAVVNTPAINLYKKHGFIEFKRWTPSHGIPKVAMSANIIFNKPELWIS